MATMTPQVGLADNGRRMTLEEFTEADFEEGYLYELARGVLEVTHVPRRWHATIIYRIYHALVVYELAHPRRIEIFGGGGEFRLVMPGLVSGRHPDVSVVLRRTPADPSGDPPPCLAVEVVSPRSVKRDYVAKRAEYLAYGLREYWIVDRRAGTITVLVRDGDVWAEHKYTGETPIVSLVLPGIVVTAAGLFADDVPEPGDDE